MNRKKIESWADKYGRTVEYWKGEHPLFPGQLKVARARRILAEKLGRSLYPGENAHHKNEIPSDDRPSNIISKLHGQHTRDHQLGRHHSNETREKIRKANLGKVVSLATKRKLSEKNKGRILTDATRKKISRKMTGRIVTAETRRKMGEANARRIVTIETRQKIGNASRNRKASIETRRKMSEAHKQRWACRKEGDKYGKNSI